MVVVYFNVLLMVHNSAKFSGANIIIDMHACTNSNIFDYKINAFEMWCYKRMLRISCTSHSTNVDVLQTIGVKETTMINNLKSRNMSRAGHIIRNTSGHHDTLLRTIEGRLD